MIEIEQQTLFDYDTLDHETRAFVKEKAQSIHSRLKRTAEDVIAIGLDLIEVKRKLPHGQFLLWIQSEFQMGQAAAYRFMQVANRFQEKLINLINFPVSVLYELAAPSTHESIVEMVETGQLLPSLPAIREAKREMQIVAEHKAEGHKETTEVPLNKQPFAVLKPALAASGFDPDDVDWEEEDEAEEETEEDSYMTAVDNGTLEYYYDDLRRTAIQRDEEERQPVMPPTKSATLIALQSSESNEWFTPAQYADAARELMGEIDVDPASNATANEVIKATMYYDITSNGLDKSWSGRVWLNPPYGRDNGGSNQEVWSHRLIEQFQSGITKEAVLLVNANTEAKWFQPFYDYLICFTNHRIKFYTNDGTPSQPTQGNALIYLGTQQEKFKSLFSQFGTVMRRYK